MITTIPIPHSPNIVAVTEYGFLALQTILTGPKPAYFQTAEWKTYNYAENKWYYHFYSEGEIKVFEISDIRIPMDYDDCAYRIKADRLFERNLISQDKWRYLAELLNSGHKGDQKMVKSLIQGLEESFLLNPIFKNSYVIKFENNPWRSAYFERIPHPMDSRQSMNAFVPEDCQGEYDTFLEDSVTWYPERFFGNPTSYESLNLSFRKPQERKKSEKNDAHVKVIWTWESLEELEQTLGKTKKDKEWCKKQTFPFSIFKEWWENEEILAHKPFQYYGTFLNWHKNAFRVVVIYNDEEASFDNTGIFLDDL